MAKDKLRLILGRVDPKRRIKSNSDRFIDLDQLMTNFLLVDNIYEISKKRYLTKAEAKSFSELASRIESDINNIIFMEFGTISNDIEIFTSLNLGIIEVINDFSQNQNRIQHSHRIPIINIPRLKSYQALASRMKERLHSLHMETDHALMEGLRALKSEYFLKPMQDLCNMRLFGERHLRDAVEIINSKNEDDDEYIEDKIKSIRKSILDIKRRNNSLNFVKINDDIENLNVIYNKFFENESSIFSNMINRMSYSRSAIKELAKIRHYLANMIKEVEKKSRTWIPARRHSKQKMKKLIKMLNDIFSENIKVVSKSIKSSINIINLLEALSSNVVAQQIYEIPKDQHQVEFKKDDDEKNIKQIFNKLKKQSEKNGFKTKLLYFEKTTGNNFSKTFKSSSIVLSDSSFISFYEIGKEKFVRFVLVFNNAIVMGTGSNYDNIKLEWMNGNKEEVRGNYTDNIYAFLNVFITSKISKDKEWLNEISGMLISSYLEHKGISPNKELLSINTNI